MTKRAKILSLAVTLIAAFFIFRGCDGCGKTTETTEITSDTTIVEVPGIVQADVPLPTVQIPSIDSSVFAQLERYKSLWLTEKNRLKNVRSELIGIEAKLLDTTIDLQKRYLLLSGANEMLSRELEKSEKVGETLQNKLEQTANGNYLIEGKDSTADYKLTYSINSFGPVKEKGFVRKVDVYQKEISTTETTTKIEYPNLYVGILYGIQPQGVKSYNLQVGKDWGKFGVISQIGMTNGLDLQIAAGLKYNFEQK